MVGSGVQRTNGLFGGPLVNFALIYLKAILQVMKLVILVRLSSLERWMM